MPKPIDFETTVKVTVKVYADGVLVAESTNDSVPIYAVNHVAGAACVQVQDPDLDAALGELAVDENPAVRFSPQRR